MQHMELLEVTWLKTALAFIHYDLFYFLNINIPGLC